MPALLYLGRRARIYLTAAERDSSYYKLEGTHKEREESDIIVSDIGWLVSSPISHLSHILSLNTRLSIL